MFDSDLIFGLKPYIILSEVFVGKPGGLSGFCALCRAPALHCAKLKAVYNILDMLDSDRTIKILLKKCW